MANSKSYANVFKTNTTAKVQSMNHPIVGRESEMVQTRAGGYAFKLDDLGAIRRFLILGTDSPTYYASQKELTIQNAQVVLDALKKGRGADVVALIEDVNTAKVSLSDMDDDEMRPAAAPRKKASIFALALCQVFADKQDKKTRMAVHNAIRNHQVISTLRQMYDFLNDLYVLTGGWNTGKISGGSGLKRAVRDWFVGSNEGYYGDRWLANQLIKYRNGSYNVDSEVELEGQDANGKKRHSIDARDVLRSLHVKPRTPVQDQLFAWVTRRDKVISANGGDAAYQGMRNIVDHGGFNSDALELVMAFEEVQLTDSADQVVRLIHKYGLSWEAVPNTWFSETRNGQDNTYQRAEIWKALLGLEAYGSLPVTNAIGKPRYSMGLTALVRNLPRLANYGLLGEMGNDVSRLIVDTLTGDNAAQNLVKARVHPIRLLSALRVYGRGYTERMKYVKNTWGNGGSQQMTRDMTWRVNGEVEQALESAFYTSFGTIGKSGVRQGYFLDISGSMGTGEIAGVPALTPREATAVFLMACMRNEDQYIIRGFSHNLIELPVRKNMTLAQVTKVISGLPFGSTDISLPARWLKENKIDLDCITIMTDNELNTGYHPTMALAEYRRARSLNTRQIVVGITSTNETVADPNDPNQLDIVGLDSTAPQVMSEFAAGRI